MGLSNVLGVADDSLVERYEHNGDDHYRTTIKVLEHAEKIT